jgi:PAS domain S-box-containing protein/excisionase family DNA binding protein
VSDDKPYYSIQEVAERLAIPVPKLRRWDMQGVLKALRSDGGHRRYPRELIDRLAAGTFNPEKATSDLATIRKSLAEKRRIIQLLLESEHRYRSLVETSHDAVCGADAQGRFTYLSQEAERIFGMSPNDLIGRCIFEFEPGKNRITNRRFFSKLKRDGQIRNYCSSIVSAQGEERWIGVNARAVNDENGHAEGFHLTIRDVTEEHLTRQHIEHLALHDGSTGLPNRLALEREIDKPVDSAAPGALLFVEVDGSGHSQDDWTDDGAADPMITGSASALRSLVPELHGQLFHVGANRFAIHLPGTLRRNATRAADQVLDALRHYRCRPGAEKVPAGVAAFVCVVLYPFHGSDAATLFANAGKAMRQARTFGGSRPVLFDNGRETVRSTHKRVTWTRKLRDALDDDRLELTAETAFRLEDRAPVHNEIRLRMRDERGRIMHSGDFTGLARSLGFIQEIDMRAVDKLLVYMQEHRLIGEKVRYFVSLSGASVADRKWTRRLFDALSVSKASPNQLVFGVSECDAMADVDATLAFNRRLKETGCRFALHDFGAGFSSFYYLRRFDVDYLKIDAALVRNLADAGNRTFVKALNDVARTLHKQVIAQEVESVEVLPALIETGTCYAQGGLFRQPVPLAPAPGRESGANAMRA